MKRFNAGIVAIGLLGALLVVVGAPGAQAGASVAPGGATVTAGQGTTARATFTPSGSVACPSVSGGGSGVTASLDETTCRDSAFSTTLRVSTSTSAAPGQYTFTITDTADGGSANFTLTVRPQPTTTTAPPPTTAPPTTAPPPTAAPTTAAPTTVAPPTTEAPRTTAAPTTTAPVVVDPGAFASVESLIAAGLPEEGVFLPLIGAGFRNCLPLRSPCGDPDSALLLLPAANVTLSWGPEPEGSTLPTRLNLASVPTLQPVGAAPADPGAVNYDLTFIDLADAGQLKTLVRGVNGQGELVSPTNAGSGVGLAFAGAEAPANARTFLASLPFAKPYRVKTERLTEAHPAIPVFLGSTRRVLYGVRTDPQWSTGGDVIPLLGNDAVPYIVRLAEGGPGLLVPVPPGLRLADQAEEAVTATADEDDDGSSSPVLPILIGVAAVAALAAAAFLFIRRRRAAATTMTHTLPFDYDVRRPGRPDQPPRPPKK